jgi:hypothetical protein
MTGCVFKLLVLAMLFERSCSLELCKLGKRFDVSIELWSVITLVYTTASATFTRANALRWLVLIEPNCSIYFDRLTQHTRTYVLQKASGPETDRPKGMREQNIFGLLNLIIDLVLIDQQRLSFSSSPPLDKPNELSLVGALDELCVVFLSVDIYFNKTFFKPFIR